MMFVFPSMWTTDYDNMNDCKCMFIQTWLKCLHRSVLFSCPVMTDSVTPWTVVRQASLSITNSWSLLKLMSIESVMPSSHLILCHPLHLLPPIPPRIRVFSNESVLHIKWPKYWSFSFSISPSSEYSGLISFWINWFYLLAVQGTLKNLLQHHSSKTSILRFSAFFMVQLSHPYLTTGKIIALTRWTFVLKVMSLLSNVSAFQCLYLHQYSMPFYFESVSSSPW